MSKPKFTYLLPAYKAKFFAEALESIKNQTYKDFLCIVSDDCSLENLKSIYDEVVGTDSRFTYRRNAENMGSTSLVSHWNLLVDMCDTEFFIMASDDDVYEPNFLEEIDYMTLRYPKINLFRGKVRYINEFHICLTEDCSLDEYYDQASFFRKYYANDMIGCEANYVYRTNIFKTKHGYVEFPKAWYTDDATHIMMAEDGCVMSKNIIFNFRLSKINISGISNNIKDSAAKVTAGLDFHLWLINYLYKFEHNKHKFSISSATSLCIRSIEDNTYLYLKNCNFRDFLFLSSRCKNELGLPLLVLYYYWIRKRIKNI